MEAGPPGSACEASLHFPPGTLHVEATPGELVTDIFWGEHATAYHVKNRGLVVISSCGHAGIIHSIRQLQTDTGSDHVHAVVGGWHLAPSPDVTVAHTVAAFQEIDPDDLIPMHCTGFNTITAIPREMPGKLMLPSTGTRVVFGASRMAVSDARRVEYGVVHDGCRSRPDLPISQLSARRCRIGRDAHGTTRLEHLWHPASCLAPARGARAL